MISDANLKGNFHIQCTLVGMMNGHLFEIYCRRARQHEAKNHSGSVFREINKSS
jgi:hypothetical protein